MKQNNRKELNYKIDIKDGKFLLWIKGKENWTLVTPNGFNSYLDAKNYLRVFKK